MNVSLPPELERFIDQQVASSRHHTPGAVVLAPLRLVADRQNRIDELRITVAEGLASLDHQGRLARDDVFDATLDRK